VPFGAILYELCMVVGDPSTLREYAEGRKYLGNRSMYTIMSFLIN